MNQTTSLTAMLSPATLKWVLVIATALAPFLIYFDTARSIVSIWNSSETFAHGYIILPISLWLQYQVLVRVSASELMFFLYWVNLPVMIAVQVAVKLLEK